MTTGPGAIGRRAARGGLLQIVGQLGSQGLRLVSNLIMTRLLEPEAFGLVAIVASVLTGLQLISDVGVWQSVMRSPRGDEQRFLDTAFTMHVARGVLLTLVGAAIAIPAALFYERPEFYALMPVAALQALIAGFESTKIASASRHLRVGKMTALEIGSQAVALCFSIPLAFAWRSPWALVVATLVAAATRTLLSHIWLDGPRNRFAWDKSVVDEILVFGRWALVATALYFVCSSWDTFAIGRLEGMARLGVFGLAVLIVSVPTQIGERINGMVLTAVLAESFREAPERFDAALQRAFGVALPAVGIFYVGAAFTAPAFFALFYRDVFGDAGWMTQLLLVSAWSLFVQASGTRALLAIGDARSMAVTNLVRLLVTVPATLVGFWLGGLVGFILGGMVGNVAGVAANAWRLRIHGVRVLGVSARASATVLGIGAAGCLLPRLVAPTLGVPAAFLTLASVAVLLAPFAFVTARRARAVLKAGF